MQKGFQQRESGKRRGASSRSFSLFCTPFIDHPTLPLFNVNCTNEAWNHPGIFGENKKIILLSRIFYSIFAVETFNGDTLHLVKLDRHQMGSYLCIASNDVPPAVSKRISLQITCELTIFYFSLLFSLFSSFRIRLFIAF